MKRYAYFWITAAFFIISIGLHWTFSWFAYVNEAAEHGQPPQMSDYWVQVARDTFENWQSEFLQLIWQVVGLAYFLYVGSPTSKEGSDRMEAKLDTLIRLQAGADADRVIASIDRRYYRDKDSAQAPA